MNQALVDRIANAVLYEGYILYPYRPSVKNRQRWTFGGLYPPAYCSAQGNSDAWAMQTECLVRGGPDSALAVKVRFLHLVARTVGELIQPLAGLPEGAEPSFRAVETLQVGDRLFHSWQEAVEREVVPADADLAKLVVRPRQQEFAFPAFRHWEPLPCPTGEVAGVMVRQQQPVRGSVQLSAERVGDGLFKVTVKVLNQTPLEGAAGQSRDEALMRSLVSTHTVLGVREGEFVSLLDPPERWRDIAADCRNVGTWPVLVGEAGKKDTILSSPIILYDYPQIAPESPGDLFDATEIDEVLTLRILTLTEEEKRAMAAVDERGRALLNRTEALAREQLMGLHGTVRGAPHSRKGTTMNDWNPLEERPRLDRVRLAEGVVLRPGDRVRLRPLGRADILDIALEGKTATVESIEQDYEDRVYLAVTVDDDPGKDFGGLRQPGHRFFFGVEEVEPLTRREDRSG